MSRCIMVLSALRSGSSCVAGALHRLGVDMGEGHFQPADKNNQAGYYEDLRWSAVTKRITGGRFYHDSFMPAEIRDEDAAEYSRLARQARAEHDIWGIKSPRMALVAHWIWPYLEDCRIVVVHRLREQSIASLQRHSAIGYPAQYSLTEGAAAEIIDRHLVAVEQRLTEFSGPVLHVSYNALLEEPEVQLSRMVRFCFQRLRSFICRRDILAIADWINPELNHHRGSA